MNVKRQKSIKGFGVVGTWINTKSLGGTLPEWLCSSQKEAISEANGNERLKQFLEDSEQWICEITIKPIKKIEAKKLFE